MIVFFLSLQRLNQSKANTYELLRNREKVEEIRMLFSDRRRPSLVVQSYNRNEIQVKSPQVRRGEAGNVKGHKQGIRG